MLNKVVTFRGLFCKSLSKTEIFYEILTLNLVILTTVVKKLFEEYLAFNCPFFIFKDLVFWPFHIFRPGNPDEKCCQHFYQHISWIFFHNETRKEQLLT